MTKNVFLDPRVYFDPSNKSVADLAASGTELCATLLERGASSAVAVAPNQLPPGDNRVKSIAVLPWNSSLDGIDLAFFDPRNLDEFNHIHDVERLVAFLERALSPQGQAFVVLRTGVIQTDWDVYNSVSLTSHGVLPASPFLYDSLLADFAVRPLKRLQAPPGVVDRVFRLSRKKPTLLLILGHSQAGKTTLARELRERDRHAHLSSDYLFSELARLKSSSGDVDPRLIGLIDGATFEDAGDFFRGVESSKDNLLAYLSIVVRLLPPGKRMVSLDLDLRRLELLDTVKSFFNEAGYSTWVVMR